MADREDSIHIKIKIDVDEEDKAFQNNLASNLSRADEEKTKISKKINVDDLDMDRIMDEVNKLEEGTIKKLIQEELEGEEITTLRKEIEEIKEKQKKTDPKDKETIRGKLEREKNALQIKQFKEGNLGKIHSFSSEKMSNLDQLVSRPFQFIFSKVAKKLGKFGVVSLIAVLVLATVNLVLQESMKPGRWLDRRFRRISRVETMNFYDQQLQEELRHGYAEMRVSTMQGLRGGQSQVNGNLFEFSAGATGILRSSPYRSSHQIGGNGYVSRGNPTDRNGSPRRSTVSRRFG